MGLQKFFNESFKSDWGENDWNVSIPSYPFHVFAYSLLALVGALLSLPGASTNSRALDGEAA